MSGLFAAIDRLLECKSEIKNWFEEQRKNTPVPFYGSFDIRDAGWKVVVVDSNAFPAGFNNIDEKDHQTLSKGIQEWFSSLDSSPKRVLLWPEAHTRNPGYMDNIWTINTLIQNTGIDVCVGTDFLKGQTFSSSKGEISLVDVDVQNHSVNADGKPVDMIILNSDLR